MSDEIPTRIPVPQGQEHVNTKQPVFRPKLNREVSMEMLCSAYVAFMNSLDPKDDLMSIEDSDKLHDSMWLFLEESFGWPDYASHN